MPPIIPASLAFAADGTPWSERYADLYHSSQGGCEQARHVFLGGNSLPDRWRNRDSFVVLETGFGLGLNFLVTWQAWLDDPQRCARLHFVSVEKHPFSRADLTTLHRRWPQLASLAEQLQLAWPPLASGFHRLRFADGRVTLTLMLGDAHELLPKLHGRCDAIYLDGFAPTKNPELWSPPLLKMLTHLAAPNATLATWSVAGEVCNALATLGWRLEKLPGFGSKRHMLRGALHRVEAAAPAPLQRQAIVIGAGIAGSACVAALAERGWTVDLIERHAGPAGEASGNPVGVLLPMLARDEGNATARLARAGYFYALRRLRELGQLESDLRWADCGIIQIALDAADEREKNETLVRLDLPADYVCFRNAEELSSLAGRHIELGGWYFPHGGWVSPPRYCSALIRSGGERVRSQFDSAAKSLERHDDLWCVLDAQGNVLAKAPHVVLANAGAAKALLPNAEFPFTTVRGQVTFLPGDRLAALPMVICRDGYVTPPADLGTNGQSISCLGATFDFTDDNDQLNLPGHRDNLRRLEELLPGAGIGLDPATLDGRVGFRTMTPDRLPLIGTLPEVSRCRPGSTLARMERIDGLHCLLGYGSRGMVWAALAAELLVAQIENEPLPLENDIIAAVDPARFLLRAVRRGSR